MFIECKEYCIVQLCFHQVVELLLFDYANRLSGDGSAYTSKAICQIANIVKQLTGVEISALHIKKNADESWPEKHIAMCGGSLLYESLAWDGGGPGSWGQGQS